MKDYVEYMDSIRVNDDLHKRIMLNISNKGQGETKVRGFREILLKKYVPAIALAAVMLLAIVGISDYFADNTKIYDQLNSTAQVPATYHDQDISQLVGLMSYDKFPFGYLLSNKLIELAVVDSNAINNGVAWMEGEFSADELESALAIATVTPELPGGDYTTRQSVLTGVETGDVIAYQTEYIFFDTSTLKFISRFSLVYLVAECFDASGLTEMVNVTVDGASVSIDEFIEPVVVHNKFPHVRKLVYMQDGVAVALEAETVLVEENGIIDYERSVERFKMADQELVEFMKSLVK
jgi:hypothetical protein